MIYNSKMLIVKNLIMLLILFLLNTNAYSEIIYDKNNLLITKYDLNLFIEKYKNFIGPEISFNDGLKKYILIINTIERIKKNNNAYLVQIDRFIEKKYGTYLKDDEILFNVLRYSQIKNDLVFDYFKNNFTDLDLLKILKNSDFKFAYSQNSCITVDGFIDYKSYNGIEKIILEKIENPNKKNLLNFNSKQYEICFDKNQLTKLESLIFLFIDQQIKKDFDNFIYESYKKQN